MIYWVLELVENFMNSATPDADAREAFLHRILARIAPIIGRLTRLQRIAALIGIDMGEEGVTNIAPFDSKAKAS